MDILKFIALFTGSHTVSYIFAGLIALSISKDIYRERDRLCDFMRDVSDVEENKRVGLYALPAQLIRGILMSIVLLPVLEYIINFENHMKFIFFFGLMFIYTHIAAVSPFIDNIEGFVYFKKKYIKRKAFFKFQVEMLIYGTVFGILMTLFL